MLGTEQLPPALRLAPGRSTTLRGSEGSAELHKLQEERTGEAQPGRGTKEPDGHVSV